MCKNGISVCIKRCSNLLLNIIDSIYVIAHSVSLRNHEDLTVGGRKTWIEQLRLHGYKNKEGISYDDHEKGDVSTNHG